MRSLVLMGFLGLMTLAGCEEKKPAPPPTPSSTFLVPTHAQSKLPTIRLWLGSQELLTEVAQTDIQEATGMMFRTNMDENAGMIFLLHYPHREAFWMTNCPLPLAAGFIDPGGNLLEVHELHANDPTPVAPESENVLYVLEVNKGWFDRHHVAPGSTVRTERGTLRETFGQ